MTTFTDELIERLLKLRTALNTGAGLRDPATVYEHQVTLDKLEAALTRPLGEGEEVHEQAKTLLRRYDLDRCDRAHTNLILAALESALLRSTPPQGEQTNRPALERAKNLVTAWTWDHVSEDGKTLKGMWLNSLIEGIRQALSTPSSIPIAPKCRLCNDTGMRPVKAFGSVDYKENCSCGAPISQLPIAPEGCVLVPRAMLTRQQRRYCQKRGMLSAAPQPLSSGDTRRMCAACNVPLGVGACKACQDVRFGTASPPPSDADEAVARALASWEGRGALGDWESLDAYLKHLEVFASVMRDDTALPAELRRCVAIIRALSPKPKGGDHGE